jgi:hypothetical protein
MNTNTPGMDPLVRFCLPIQLQQWIQQYRAPHPESSHSETGAHHRAQPTVDPGVERDHTHQTQISWTQKQGVLQGVSQGQCREGECVLQISY